MITLQECDDLNVKNNIYSYINKNLKLYVILFDGPKLTHSMNKYCKCYA